MFYAAEVLLALQYLHHHKIVYRDLKPENIVLSIPERGHIKLVDFGFSKSLKQTGKTFTNCGTPVYIAPEIIIGNGHSYEVDIWSLGVLICEMASGTTPFQSDSTAAVYDKIKKCDYTFSRKVNGITRDLLERIFVTDVDSRPTINEIKQHELFKAFDFGISTHELLK